MHDPCVRANSPHRAGEGGAVKNSKLDLPHLRQVALNRFDVQLLTLLTKSGGEYLMPETAEARAMIEITRSKRLVEVVERVGERPRVRLTDEGRTVAAQLEVMAVQPKVEIDTR